MKAILAALALASLCGALPARADQVDAFPTVDPWNVLERLPTLPWGSLDAKLGKPYGYPGSPRIEMPSMDDAGFDRWPLYDRGVEPVYRCDAIGCNGEVVDEPIFLEDCGTGKPC